MKRVMILLVTVSLSLALAACGAKKEYDPTGDICPGKQPGVAGNAPVWAAGLNPDEDMRFETRDVKGNPITNEIFSGTERGVWVVFWETDSDQSTQELQRLDRMMDTAQAHGYKILGVVMDGEKSAQKAAEMTADLRFDNILWNDSMAKRYPGIADFFEKEHYETLRAEMEQMGIEKLPALGDPVSTRMNSRGQVQTSCYLIPIGEKKLVEMWRDNDSNATYEELIEQEKNALNGKE